jgi:oxygen-independent coproporphyrinogen-3 oxidase
VAQNPEITLEANPDDLTEKKLRAFHFGGINRLSIGIQSFREQDLVLMNRAHNAQEAKSCLEMVKKYFDNISIDLIYGIPGLSEEAWEENLRQALSFGFPHISSYALTVEPGTALKKFIDKKVVPPVDEEAAEAQFRFMINLLKAHDFVHYELSNFGKPGFFSRNNTAYWQGKPYLGIGPSAHSYDGRKRRWNLRNNPGYLKALKNLKPPYQEETLSPRDRYNEYIMTGLRTIWGVSLEKVRQDFGLAYNDYLLQEAGPYLDRKLLSLDNDVLRVTDAGKFLTDGIASDLFKI